MAQVQSGHLADCSNPYNVVVIRIRFCVYLEAFGRTIVAILPLGHSLDRCKSPVYSTIATFEDPVCAKIPFHNVPFTPRTAGCQIE